MRKKVAILITAMAVFSLLYFVTRQAQREGKKCSLFFIIILFLKDLFSLHYKIVYSLEQKESDFFLFAKF